MKRESEKTPATRQCCMMLPLVWTVGVLAAGLFAGTHGQRISNRQYKRTVYLTGAVVREEHMIEARVEDGPPMLSSDFPGELAQELHASWFPSYVFVVEKEQVANLATWDARLIPHPGRAETQPLEITDITSESPVCQRLGHKCLSVSLPAGRGATFVVSLVLLEQMTPHPFVRRDQVASLRLLYRTDSFDPLSIYPTGTSQTVLAIGSESKSLRLRCPVGRKPEKLADKLPFDMKGYTCTGTTRGSAEMHIEAHNMAFARVTRLHRRLTLLPWSRTIQVTESYEIEHKGFRQPETPSFSRMDYVKFLHKNQGHTGASQMLSKMMLVVPTTARGIQVRDEVGINWAEMPRQSVEEGFDVVDVPFRFPLLGGMSSAFDFHYTVPYATYLRPFKATSSPFKQLLQFHLCRLSVDIPVERFTLSVSLPEDAADIEHELATHKTVKLTRRRYRTYFTTKGETEVQLEMTRVTRDDLESMLSILFDYPWWGVGRKPLAAALLVVLMTMAAVFISRVRPSLHPRRQEKAHERVDVFFAKRRELLLDYEDVIAVNVNARADGAQQKADSQLCSHLDEQLERLEGAIFEKIKRGAQDPQQTTLESIALRRMYGEQRAVVRKMVEEAVRRGTSGTSGAASAASLATGPSQHASNVSLSSLKMSRSSSANILNCPLQATDSLCQLAREASALDAQIVEYEAKFCKQ